MACTLEDVACKLKNRAVFRFSRAKTVFPILKNTEIYRHCYRVTITIASSYLGNVAFHSTSKTITGEDRHDPRRTCCKNFKAEARQHSPRRPRVDLRVLFDFRPTKTELAERKESDTRLETRGLGIFSTKKWKTCVTK